MFDTARWAGRKTTGLSRLPSKASKIPWLHCRPVTHTPLSSRGLGRRILSPETRVRIPVAVPRQSLAFAGLFHFAALRSQETLSRICREICVAARPGGGWVACVPQGDAELGLQIVFNATEDSPELSDLYRALTDLDK
jgi:hypothetical protein